MTKFKVGDKVRIVKVRNDNSREYLGRVDTIEMVDSNCAGNFYVLSHMNCCNWCEDCLQLVEKKPTHKIDCSLVVNYGKEKKRMCKYFQSGHNCANCPLGTLRNDFNIVCRMMVEEKPTEAIAIVQKWSDEHPEKTIKDDFLEKYPNALMNAGCPPVCAQDLGYISQYSSCSFDCEDCWNTPLSEVQK